MEWSDYHSRVTIVGLHKVGKTAKQIYTLLHTLKINEWFVYCTLERFRLTGDVVDRAREGRPRTVRTKKVMEAVRSRVNQNPCRKQKILAKQMKISRRTLARIINEDLGLRALKKHTGQLLTPQLKELRFKRSKELYRLYGKEFYKRILFTDEKVFTIEEKFNPQNDRVYARTSQDAQRKAPRVQRGHFPASVMIWWGVLWNGATEVHFCEPGVKINAKVYQETVLEWIVKPLNTTLFHGEHWVYQQDSAPSHKAKSMQEWLENNVPDFISHQEWTSGSPDLNPLDYSLWDILESEVCATRHPNLESLKRSIVEKAASMPLEVIHTAISKWPERLKKCIEVKGGHFE